VRDDVLAAKQEVFDALPVDKPHERSAQSSVHPAVLLPARSPRDGTMTVDHPAAGSVRDAS
jgi:hypothetical protein